MNPQGFGYGQQYIPPGHYGHSSQQYAAQPSAGFSPNYAIQTPSPAAYSNTYASSSTQNVLVAPGVPSNSAPVQQIVPLPSSIFVNTAPLCPQLSDVFPFPTGTKYSSYLEDLSIQRQSEEIQNTPSPKLVNNLANHLGTVSVHPVSFKKPEGTTAAHHALTESAPVVSPLEAYIQHSNPALELRRSKRIKLKQPIPAAPSTSVAPLVSSPKQSEQYGSSSYPLQQPGDTGTGSSSPPSGETSGVKAKPAQTIPKLTIKLAAAQPVATVPVQEAAAVPPASAEVRREEPKKGIKMVFRIKNAPAPEENAPVKPATPKIQDENQRQVSDERERPAQSASPEYPEPALHSNRSFPNETKILQEKVEHSSSASSAAPGAVDEFDPSKLTLKISKVSVETANKVFNLAFSSSASKARGKMPVSSRKSAALPQITRTKEARKLLPYSPEASQEHPTLQSFLMTMDRVMQSMSQVDLRGLAMNDPAAQLTDADIPSDAVLSQNLAYTLAAETAKLKAHDQARFVPIQNLRNLLVAIMPTVLHATVIPTDLINYSQDGEDADASVYRDIVAHRIIRGAEAVVSALNIITSPHLPREICNSEVVDACIRFAKHHAVHTVYPAFDPLYRYEAQSKDGFVAKVKQKRARSGQTKDETILRLYSRFEDIVILLADAVMLRAVEETPLFQLASLGISAFFVENIRDLQLKSLRLVAHIFCRYEKLRESICDDILSSLAKLPSSKRNLRNYVVSSTESIQMISALILHLVQSIARLPSKRQLVQRSDGQGRIEDYEATVLVSYDESVRCAKQILSTFFMKCAAKGDEDYRPLLENFINDLLTIVNKPEWPAAETMLSVMGFILMQKFNDKTLDANFRYASIDYLGMITARMRRDALSVKENPDQLQELVTKLYRAFSISGHGLIELGDTMPNEEQLFQQGILHYIWHSAPSPNFAANYYLAQWYHDATHGTTTPLCKTDDDDTDSDNRTMDDRARTKSTVLDFMKVAVEHGHRHIAAGKEVVDTASANLIARHFAINRPFAKNFETYFKRLIAMANDNSMQIRIRAIKAVSSVMDSDGSLMTRDNVKSLVESRMWDNSASIRDSVVEMIGTYAKNNPEQIQQYSDVLLKRLQDTAPSVRKRSIKVLHDFVVQCPEHELCVPLLANIIKRINDNEETVKKLVYDVFQALWLESSHKDDIKVTHRVSQIIAVVQILDREKLSATHWFEKMVKELLKRGDDQTRKSAKKACKAVVDRIVRNVLDLNVDMDQKESQWVAASFLTLSIFAKCDPDFIADHIQSLPLFLNQTLKSQSDQKVVCFTANMLAQIVPLMKNPPDFFLAQIEESCAALFVKTGISIPIMQAAMECLAAVVNNETHNYEIVRGLYEKFWQILQTKKAETKDYNIVAPQLQRAMCVVSLAVEHFDIDHESFGFVQMRTDRVIETFLSLLRHPLTPIQDRALQSLGFIFIRKPEAMLQKKYSDIYNGLLASSNHRIETKKMVLTNLIKYLEYEESQVLMMEGSGTAQEHYAALDLKGNQTSVVELPRKIVFHYLKATLECGLHPDGGIRKDVLDLIGIVVRLRMSHPQQVIPFLIAISTDPEETMAEKANNLLDEISKRYHASNILPTKALSGIKESFSFQKSLQPNVVVRGYRTVLQSGPASLVGNIYAALRSDRAQRRILINSMLETFKFKDSPLDLLLYFADNLAYFNYTNLDEPHYIIHQLEPILAMVSPDALHRFRKAFKLNHQKSAEEMESDELLDDDDLETVDNMRRCIPEDLSELHQCYRNCQPSLLLIALKRFVASLYCITPAKAKEYLPSEPKQVWEKPVTSRRANCKYEPTAVCEFVSREMRGELSDFLTPQLLIKKFLEFKTVVNLIDDRETAGDDVPKPGASDSVAPDGDDMDDLDDDEHNVVDNVNEAPVGSPAPTASNSVAPDPVSESSTPQKKRKADASFKKPRPPKRRLEPGTPKRTRGRPKREKVAQSTSDSEEEDESYRP
ncbi:nipped-B-like protein A [Paramacrobiotus metropolitanus]|uniref:nipped-B-like protein A n=1 Tax=Paramacrobiotus metropolitanus TaxID=2943436 RepID=UPI0024459C0B|nr:nipped-B-like protein A [Paramacrobiotus metropolitanus]XP_055327159.1 nipped-B-like protein A [Paramacrobiotus metropolitanus]XP_055358023.1 nipped-B-like protein A [Paramacrobiotus metropolitanus]